MQTLRERKDMNETLYKSIYIEKPAVSFYWRLPRKEDIGRLMLEREKTFQSEFRHFDILMWRNTIYEGRLASDK